MIKGTKKTDFKGKLLTVIHNKEKAPKLGNEYGQEVEPAGYFCLQKGSPVLLDNWEQKKIVLKNPIIVNVSKDLIKWKYTISDKYKLKGKKLTKKLQNNGFDGIITLEKTGKFMGYTGEIIIFDISLSEIL